MYRMCICVYVIYISYIYIIFKHATLFFYIIDMSKITKLGIFCVLLCRTASNTSHIMSTVHLSKQIWQGMLSVNIHCLLQHY